MIITIPTIKVQFHSTPLIVYNMHEIMLAISKGLTHTELWQLYDVFLTYFMSYLAKIRIQKTTVQYRTICLKCVLCTSNHIQFHLVASLQIQLHNWHSKYHLWKNSTWAIHLHSQKLGLLKQKQAYMDDILVLFLNVTDLAPHTADTLHYTTHTANTVCKILM
jgi:hypothetical protein